MATEYVSQLTSCLTDESISKLWRAKGASLTRVSVVGSPDSNRWHIIVSSYSASKADTPFLSYFASTTPESESKRIRLKTVLFLSASSLYDLPPIRDKLLEHQKIFALELAIIEGKVGSSFGLSLFSLTDKGEAR